MSEVKDWDLRPDGAPIAQGLTRLALGSWQKDVVIRLEWTGPTGEAEQTNGSVQIALSALAAKEFAEKLLALTATNPQ